MPVSEEERVRLLIEVAATSRGDAHAQVKAASEKFFVEIAENTVLGPALIPEICPREEKQLIECSPARLRELAQEMTRRKFLHPAVLEHIDRSASDSPRLANQLVGALRRFDMYRCNDTQPDLDEVDWTSDDAITAYQNKVMDRV
jgi:hypothetical protein